MRAQFVIGLISVLGVTHAFADEASDFAGLDADASALTGRQQELLSDEREYLEVNLSLRRQSDEDLARLINEICGTDIEGSENDGLNMAAQIADEIAEKIGVGYASLEKDKNDFLYKIDKQQGDLQSVKSEFGHLESSTEYGERAKPILAEITRQIEETKTVKNNVLRDFNSLSNIVDGIMRGSNNPQVRAAMDYGKDQHKNKQDELKCDDREVPAAGGYADCVKFTESDGCVVIEIKPDSYSETKAIAQAERYIDGLKTKYKDNDNAKQYCKKDSDDNWIFTARWETYPACKPGRF